jgi:xylulokinase
MAYLLMGFDVGSSSVKGSLIDAETGKLVASYTSPATELMMYAPQVGWAQQNPGVWWNHVGIVSQKILENADAGDVKGVGISYQMHGLVVVDKKGRVLYPSIIWCDGRTQAMGEKAAQDLMTPFLEKALNYPGNFTATKLAWLKENEPGVYKNVHKAMLPGDFIAMKLTGETHTTPSGLSEGIMWDYQHQCLLTDVLEYFGIDGEMIPSTIPTFSPLGGEVTGAAARKTGLRKGTPVAYRAGDQPNNALSLNVLEPGEAATTAGTSGVIYVVTDQKVFDPETRVNVFVHVNHKPEGEEYSTLASENRYGILGCINGTGSMYRFLKGLFEDDYVEMNEIAKKVPAGCKGMMILPYGNGPERTLGGKNRGMSVHNVDFNVHGENIRGYMARAAQEGIVFALKQGFEPMNKMAGSDVKRVRAGEANMFLCDGFGDIFSSALGVEVDLYETDGSQGAARGAGIGRGKYRDRDEAFVGLKPVRTISPDPALSRAYADLYPEWQNTLQRNLE